MRSSTKHKISQVYLHIGISVLCSFYVLNRYVYVILCYKHEIILNLCVLMKVKHFICVDSEKGYGFTNPTFECCWLRFGSGDTDKTFDMYMVSK